MFNKCCDFADLHFAYEDITAKVLKMIMEDGPSSISAPILKRMYEQNPNVSETDQASKDVKSAFNFIKKAFKDTPNPKLKKYAVMDLAVIVNGMLKTYDVSKYPSQFADVFLKFDTERILNKERPEENQDPKLLAYSNATRADSLESIEYRQKMLKDYIIEQMPYLEVKDNNRFFTSDQRTAIYRLGEGICANCHCPVSEDEFEADHILPWSRGGEDSNL